MRDYIKSFKPDSNSPMELDSVPSTEAQNDPWNGSSDGLPAKVLRYDNSPDETMENTVTPDDSEATPLIDPYEATSINKESNETTPRKVVVMEWHSCAICLEEMVDSELLTHTPCGALLCATCLESSQQHIATESGHMPCPVSDVITKTTVIITVSFSSSSFSSSSFSSSYSSSSYSSSSSS